ncbi:MAG TPA: hypothetical protein VFK06_06855 [Candidatus Angelobacter sp.]|nr:hypothetical protein [Candidatus Angelobacter sp.]
MGVQHTLLFQVQLPENSLGCRVDFLISPRGYLAVLPSHARANLFAGD